MKFWEAMKELQSGEKVRQKGWSYLDTAYLTKNKDGFIVAVYEDKDGEFKQELPSWTCVNKEWEKYNPKRNPLL